MHCLSDAGIDLLQGATQSECHSVASSPAVLIEQLPFGARVGELAGLPGLPSGRNQLAKLRSCISADPSDVVGLSVPPFPAAIAIHERG